MSNLLKQPYVIHKSEEACIINSNRLVEERLREFQRAQMAEENKKNASVPREEAFVEGLFVEGLFQNEVNEPKEEEMPQITQEEILAQANEQAEAILAEARVQADIIINDANQQAKQIFDAEKEAGYAAGRQQLEQEFEEKKTVLEEEFRQKKESVRQEYLTKQETMEQEIVEALIPVFDKVFHVQFEDKKDILIHLINNTLLNIDAGKNFRIRVSRDNCSFVEEHLQPLREQLGNAVSMEVIGDNRMEGMDCQIESDFGTFDCGLDMELNNLLKDIRSLCI